MITHGSPEVGKVTPDKYSTVITLYPVCVVTPKTLNIQYIVLLNILDFIYKYPLIVPEIVWNESNQLVTFIPSTFKRSINNEVTLVKVLLLNLKYPFPGSA